MGEVKQNRKTCFTNAHSLHSEILQSSYKHLVLKTSNFIHNNTGLVYLSYVSREQKSNYIMSGKITSLHSKTNYNSHIHKWFCDCHSVKLHIEHVSSGAKLIKAIASLQQKLYLLLLHSKCWLFPFQGQNTKEKNETYPCILTKCCK